jgi:hypothetical protein
VSAERTNVNEPAEDTRGGDVSGRWGRASCAAAPRARRKVRRQNAAEMRARRLEPSMTGTREEADATYDHPPIAEEPALKLADRV